MTRIGRGREAFHEVGGALTDEGVDEVVGYRAHPLLAGGDAPGAKPGRIPGRG